jgi:hypothetical protein
MQTMKQLRILGLSLLALFAFGVVTASMASAEEGVLEPANFTFKGGTAELKNLNNETIVCKANSGSGVFLAAKEKDQHATGTIDFTGCTALGFPANTLGDPSGTILANVLFLVCLTNSATLLFGFLIEPTETVHVEVPFGKILILVKGAVIGSLVKAGEVAGKEFEITFAEKDEAKRLECEINGKKFKSTYEAAKDTEPDVDAFQTGTGSVTFAKEVKFMDK